MLDLFTCIIPNVSHNVTTTTSLFEGSYLLPGVVWFILQGMSAQQVELSMFILFSVRIFLTIQKDLSELALLWGMQRIAFTRDARPVNLSSFPNRPQNLPTHSSCGRLGSPPTLPSAYLLLLTGLAEETGPLAFPLKLKKKWNDAWLHDLSFCLHLTIKTKPNPTCLEWCRADRLGPASRGRWAFGEGLQHLSNRCIPEGSHCPKS